MYVKTLEINTLFHLQGSSTTDWPKEVYEKKRMNLQGTKKKGCEATMHLKWIELYPDFQVRNMQPQVKKIFVG